MGKIRNACASSDLRQRNGSHCSDTAHGLSTREDGTSTQDSADIGPQVGNGFRQSAVKKRNQNFTTRHFSLYTFRTVLAPSGSSTDRNWCKRDTLLQSVGRV